MSNNKDDNFYDREKDWDEFTNNIGDDLIKVAEDEDFLEEISSSLATQISSEMGDMGERTMARKKKKKYKGLKIFAIVFSLFMVILAGLFFTTPGRKLIINIAGKYIHGKLNVDKDTNPPGQENPDGSGEEDKGPIIIDEVVNVLLLGVEEIEGGANTDSIMIATMNTKNKTMKVTSIMRDLYVEIPGYNKNRINSVYAKGGIDLLYQVIELNLDIKLDGYVLVNFNAFEKIVDLVGGVEITLTKGEAHYLNTTNYISNPRYRNVKEGTQILNGNQALGYSRVRKRSTGTENNDFGRTQRHRIVMNAIFEKMKSKNVIQLGLLMNDILTNINIKTDITERQFTRYLEEAITLNVHSLDMYRIPTDDNYVNLKVKFTTNGKPQEVLDPKDWSLTRSELRKFIYGEE